MTKKKTNTFYVTKTKKCRGEKITFVLSSSLRIPDPYLRLGVPDPFLLLGEPRLVINLLSTCLGIDSLNPCPLLSGLSTILSPSGCTTHRI